MIFFSVSRGENRVGIHQRSKKCYIALVTAVKKLVKRISLKRRNSRSNMCYISKFLIYVIKSKSESKVHCLGDDFLT